MRASGSVRKSSTKRSNFERSSDPPATPATVAVGVEHRHGDGDDRHVRQPAEDDVGDRQSAASAPLR